MAVSGVPQDENCSCTAPRRLAEGPSAVRCGNPVGAGCLRLVGGLVVRQAMVRPDMIVVEPEAGYVRGIVLLEAPNDLLAMPYGVLVEGPHLVVVCVARYVDVFYGLITLQLYCLYFEISNL